MCERGFTLVEMLVVLVIVGMASSFVGPRIWNSYVHARDRSAVRNFSDALVHLRLDSWHQGQMLALPEVTPDQPRVSSPPWPLLEQGWRLLRADALRFLPNGATNGGRVVLEAPDGSQWQLMFSPLRGRVTIHTL